MFLSIMNESNNNHIRLTRFLLAAGLSLLMGLLTSQAWAADPQTRETRISLPAAGANPDLLVNELIFTWVTDKETGIVTEQDLTYFSLKIDNTIPKFGGAFFDEMIVDSLVQPTGSTEPRTLDDVIWEFDLDNDQVLQFRNLVEVAGTPGFIFQVEGGLNFGGDYEIVFFSESDSDRTWEAAQLDALSRGGYLATSTSAAENAEIQTAIQNALATAGLGPQRQLYLGGFQDFSLCEDPSPSVQLATCGWTWVNGEGLIYDGFLNWDGGEPNDSGQEESVLGINKDGTGKWNDTRVTSDLQLTGGYVIEFPDFAVRLTVYEDGFIDAQETEEELTQRTALIDLGSGTVRDIPTPVGDITIFDLPQIEYEANVVAEGLTNVDFCVAPDPREITKRFWGRTRNIFIPGNYTCPNWQVPERAPGIFQ